MLNADTASIVLLYDSKSVVNSPVCSNYMRVVDVLMKTLSRSCTF